MLDFISAQTLVIIRIDMKNHAFKALAFQSAGSGLLFEVLIISAPVDIQHPAEGLDIVLEAELVASA